MLKLNKEQMTAYEDVYEDKVNKVREELRKQYGDDFGMQTVDLDKIKMQSLEIALEG